MRRGEVWWAEFPAPVGRRPVVLVSRDRAIQVREMITVVVVTSTVRGIPTEVPLGPSECLPKACVANADLVQTIPKRRLTRRLTALSPENAARLGSALRFALAL